MAPLEQTEARPRPSTMRALAARGGLAAVALAVASAFLAWLTLLSWLAFKGVTGVIHLL